MKTILRGAVAAIALVSMSGVGHAQTNELHYAGPKVVVIPGIWSIPAYEITNPGIIGAAAGEAGVLARVGTRYTAEADAPGDSTPATPSISVAFTLTGEVNKDCSFYSGNNAAARNIDFGVIGVRTGDNENVNQAFEMVGPAEADIETLTAGCNFNNTVKIEKTNGLQGLVNATPGGFDSNEFQANIPYSVTASWVGVSQAGAALGSRQELEVGTNQASNELRQGAWRSSMNIGIDAPVVNKGLVAGAYKDTMTLKLSAI